MLGKSGFCCIPISDLRYTVLKITCCIFRSRPAKIMSTVFQNISFVDFLYSISRLLIYA